MKGAPFSFVMVCSMLCTYNGCMKDLGSYILMVVILQVLVNEKGRDRHG